MGLNRWVAKKVKLGHEGEIGPFYFRVRDESPFRLRHPVARLSVLCEVWNLAWSRCRYALWRFRKSGSPTLKSVRVG